MQHSVLSHLVNRFGTGPENLATEALAFILNTSVSAQAAFRETLTRLGAQMPARLFFQTQLADDSKARPDLIGKGPNNEVFVVLEVKFWAGLTDNQPMGYLTSNMAPVPGGCLLFIAPEKRSTVLWSELMRRAKRLVDAGGESRCVIEGRTLALTSWSLLLNQMLAAAAAAHDASAVENLRQLSALCEQMDTTGFLPLQSDELTGSLGRRVVQFTELVDATVATMSTKHSADISGTKVINPGASHGRYMRIGGYGTLLQFSPQLWAAWGDSPLWLSLQDENWAKSNVVGLALQVAAVPYREGPRRHHVPLYLPLQVEKDAVVDDLREQILCIMSKLPQRGAQVIRPTPNDDVVS